LNCDCEFKQTGTKKKFCSVKCNSRYNLKTINANEPKKSKTRPELLFKKLLEDNNIDFIFQKSVSWKRGWKKWFDFYLPDQNLLIEVDGIYWHGKGVKTKDLNKQQWKTRLNDRLKNILAKNRGYNLLRIWSDEISNVKFKKGKLL
jgi:very-short-patch-repair endonuclease